MVFRRLIALALLSAVAMFGLSLNAFARPARTCATTGDLICSTRAYRAAVHQLRIQPALTLPGQWERPNGRVLVAECKDSYPNTLADKGVPNEELMICLTDPDPRLTDHRVITMRHWHLIQLMRRWCERWHRH